MDKLPKNKKFVLRVSKDLYELLNRSCNHVENGYVSKSIPNISLLNINYNLDNTPKKPIYTFKSPNKLFN